jgi:hypothetical protein
MKRMNGLMAVACLAFSLGLLGGCSRGATIMGTVYVNDMDDGNIYKVCPGAEVDLLAGGATVDSETTGSTGEYLFEKVAAGTYDLRAVYTLPSMSYAMNGYGWMDGANWKALTISGTSSPYSITYSGLTVVAGDSVVLNFGLVGY